MIRRIRTSWLSIKNSLSLTRLSAAMPPPLNVIFLLVEAGRFCRQWCDRPITAKAEIEMLNLPNRYQLAGPIRCYVHSSGTYLGSTKRMQEVCCIRG